MKNSTFALCLLAVFLMGLWACKSHPSTQWTYQVTGEVPTATGPHPAIWYTDTLSFKGDTAYYINSDGTVMSILPPYKIDTLK